MEEVAEISNPNDASSATLEEKVRELELDNKRLRDEFDSQRAKLKDLFMQKEGELQRKNKENSKLTDEVDRIKEELDEAKNQLVLAGITLEDNLDVEKRKAQEEIASLQQLVHETVEESSSCKTIYNQQLQKLHMVIKDLEAENVELKSERQQSPHHYMQEQTSMAPSVMLSAVTKTLVRKLGADAFTSQDSMEDSMRKVDDDHAQEDVEVLRSLVVPLEEEIKALKDKLRTTDEQLQKYQQCKNIDLVELQGQSTGDSFHSTATNTSFDASKYPIEPYVSAVPCDMCSNYEAELVKEQKRAEDLQNKVIAAEKSAERHREELLKEIGFRKEIEEKWNEKKEQHKQQVAELTTRTDCAEQDLKELQQMFKQSRAEVNKHLASLTYDREKFKQELEKLQNENDNLIGKYSMHSQQLQNEIIDLPSTVEELQELILKSQQDLITAKIGKEVSVEEVNTLRSDIRLLKDQITNDQQIKESLENNLAAEINTLKTHQHQLEKELKLHLSTVDKLQSLEKSHQDTLVQLEDLQKSKKQVELLNNELRARVGSLQQELDNGEAVQKDFVRLSQNLQVQLQKIRDSDTQVRWQHDEDVEFCPACRLAFNVTKRTKLHCRHCGQIFCVTCLSHTVSSGPQQRLSKVCDVCHTLLVKSSAPYFSTEVPHSPD